MFAISSDALINIALGGIGGSVLLAIISAMVVKSIIGKVISLVVTAAIALALYSQQDQLKSCADKIESGISTPGKTAVCTFFGQDITIKNPLESPNN